MSTARSRPAVWIPRSPARAAPVRPSRDRRAISRSRRRRRISLAAASLSHRTGPAPRRRSPRASHSAVGGGEPAVTDIVAHAGQSSLGGHVAFDLTLNLVGINGDIKADAVMPGRRGAAARAAREWIGRGVVQCGARRRRVRPLSGAVTFKGCARPLSRCIAGGAGFRVSRIPPHRRWRSMISRRASPADGSMDRWRSSATPTVLRFMPGSA